MKALINKLVLAVTLSAAGALAFANVQADESLVVAETSLHQELARELKGSVEALYRENAAGLEKSLRAELSRELKGNIEALSRKGLSSERRWSAETEAAPAAVAPDQGAITRAERTDAAQRSQTRPDFSL